MTAREIFENVINIHLLATTNGKFVNGIFVHVLYSGLQILFTPQFYFSNLCSG